MSVRAVARRAAASPLLRCALLGAALLAARETLFREPAAEKPRAERQPIVVSAERARSLEKEFGARWERPPSPAERSALLAQAVQDEMLYREARVLALGLDDASVRRRLIELMRALGETRGRDDDALVREAVALGLDDDVVIRRLLAEKMRLVLQRGESAPAIRDADLAALLERERARFLQPEAITLQQVFVSSDARGEPAAARAAAALLADLRSGKLSAADAAQRSDALPFATELRAQPRLKVQGMLGKAFADRVFALDAGAWSGPIASPFGLHVVRVVERRPARLPALEEVRPALVEALRRERADANFARGLTRLRALYEVRIEDAQVASAQSASPTSSTTVSLQDGGGGGLLASATQPVRSTRP